MTTNLHDKMLKAIDALFSASDRDEEREAEDLLLDVRDEILKHKLAAESLTEGLRLDDWDKIGCVNHDCDQCKAQQEPVAWGNLANWCLDSDRVLITDKDDAARYHRDVYDLTPLYTTPQAQPRGEATLAREPLTDEQIDAEFDAFASKFDHESNEWLDMGVDAYFRAGFKAAHGITKGNT